MKGFAILFIVSGVICEEGTTSYFFEGNETDASSFENLTSPIVDSKIESTSETVTLNQTDI
ncbi:hypothetical protein NPIL_290821, partial [Nephila pilipes]